MHADVKRAHLSNDAVGLLLICHGRLPWLIDVLGRKGLERRDEVPGRQEVHISASNAKWGQGLSPHGLMSQQEQREGEGVQGRGLHHAEQLATACM